MAEEKQFQSALPALIQSMFGTKSSEKQTATTTANTAPLQQVFDRAQAPMDQQLYDNLIASIFQKAAVQVPTLTAALANATGSRTSNNSPLALALNEQNNMAARDSASAILGQQNTQAQIAQQAASGIVQGTKSTTQSVSGTAGKPGIDPLTMTALGFLLNKADKGKWFDKAGDKLSSLFSPAPATNFPVSAPSFGTAAAGGPTTSFAENMPVLNGALPTSLAGDYGGGSLESLLSGLGGGASTNSLANFDFSSLFSGGVDDGSYFGVDNILSGIGGSGDFGFSDILSGGNAFTGGLGGGGSELLTDDIWQFFADGGSVQRNRNNMGRSPTLFGQSAINAPAVAVGGAGNTGVSSDMLMQLLDRVSKQEQANPSARAGAPQAATADTGEGPRSDTKETSGMAVNARAGNPLGASVAQALAMAALGMIAPQVVGGVTGSLPAAQMTNMSIKGVSGQSTSPVNLAAALAKAVAAERGATSAIDTSTDPLGAMLAAFSAIDGSVGNVSGLSSDVLAAGANAASSVTGTNPLEALLAATNAFGTGTNSDALARGANAEAARTGGDALDALMGATNAFGTGGGDSSSGLGGGASLGSNAGLGGNSEPFADGGLTRSKRSSKGMIPGPKGSGTADNVRAKSTVPGTPDIRVSGREFIVPADVVAVPGVQSMLEMMLKQYHTPVNR